MSFPWTSMSIASFGDSTLPKKTKREWSVKETNRTDDVDGAQCAVAPVWNKPDLWDNSDVSGAKPIKLHRERNVPNTSLKVDDIDGAQAKIRDKMLLTKRCVNPMEPDYKMASSTPASHVEPKFLRNTLNIDDIEKARPTIPRVYDMRDPISVADIVGAQANWRPRHEEARLKAPPYDLMQSADVSKSNRYVDKTHRHNCPLDPAYTFHGEQIQDNPRYSKPKGLPKYIADNHLLQTRDIAGAFPGWTQSTLERREFKNTNFVQDIDGAQADTIKHSMVTKRCTNPQNKVYVGLDGDLLVAPVVSLLPPEIIKRPTLRDTGRGEGGDGSSQSARRHVETVDVTNKDALGQQMMKSARSSSKPSSPRRTSVLGTELAEREASPRPKGMTTIDSAAYSNSKPPVANSNATRPPARAPSDNNSSNTRNAWGTPRSARGAGPESHTYKQENYLGNTNTMNLYQDSDAIAFADKFVKSEMLIMPTRQPQQQQGNNGGISSRPPTGGSGHGNSSARGGGYGSARVPQLDLNNMGTGSLSARQGQASGRAGAASGRVGSARSARPTKEEAQLNVDIMSVRALE